MTRRLLMASVVIPLMHVLMLLVCKVSRPLTRRFFAASVVLSLTHVLMPLLCKGPLTRQLLMASVYH